MLDFPYMWMVLVLSTNPTYRRKSGRPFTRIFTLEGKNYVKFMVGMAYNRGVVKCVSVQHKMSGGYYSQLEETDISQVLDDMNSCSRKILQDGCLCHNSRKAFRMMEQQNIAVFEIPARSPDLNPIGNLFNQVKYQLRPISFCV